MPIVEGMPMDESNLWCEVILNGEPYKFSPEYYEGLTDTSEKVYYNTSGVDGLYVGSFSTIYLKEYKGKFNEIKSLAVVIGYAANGETRRSETVYVDGFEPFEDKAFMPSTPSNLVYYKDYYHKIRFKFDGKDIEGNAISDRILGIEILLDGTPLVFKDSDYYFNGGNGADVTMIGLKKSSVNYSSSLVNNYGDEYVLSLWGHNNGIPDFDRLAIRPVCTGANTVTYGESCEIILERAAKPANPLNVEYDKEAKTLKFEAMPIDTEGNGLSPEKYGYEIYVNEELYVFKADLYDLDNDISLIPYGGVNYDLYMSTDYVYDDNWTCIGEMPRMSITMGRDETEINKIGVRAVYTDGNGNTTYSAIINSDGTTSVHDVIYNDGPVKWYNLQGIEVTNPVPGTIYLRKQGDAITKVLVK